MEAKMKSKFDCIEFKRKAQERIFRDIRDMTPEDQREYFRLKAESGPLGEWWKAKKRETVASSRDAGMSNGTTRAGT